MAQNALQLHSTQAPSGSRLVNQHADQLSALHVAGVFSQVKGNVCRSGAHQPDMIDAAEDRDKWMAAAAPSLTLSSRPGSMATSESEALAQVRTCLISSPYVIAF